MEINISNPCVERKTLHCINCNNHFMTVRPSIKSIIVSRHFVKDLKNEKEMNSIIKEVLDCSDLGFTELHKFEENIDGNLVFRAKKERLHIVYCVDKKMRIIFLRAFRNYNEYARFLEDKKEIKKMIVHL